MRIVFLGTPEFAVATLKILVENEYNIVGVITAPDRFGGRGMKQLIESDVKKYAKSQGLYIMQPSNLKSDAFIEDLKSRNADLQIVVAFRMLPEKVWNMPRLGTYNLHGSLLPKYRGAAPINWAIIMGEEYTGVTSFKLKHEIDTGNIAFQERIKITEDDNSGSLHDKMMELGAQVMLKTVKAIESDQIPLLTQDETAVSKAPKIYHEDCEIDFNKTAVEIHNFIRGLSPYPTAWTNLESKKLKIFKSSYSLVSHQYRPGHILSNNKDHLHFCCTDGWISIQEMQYEGRKKMDINSFLNGIKIESAIIDE